MDKTFELDLPTLSKLNFYVFVPALLFIKILYADISLEQMLNIILFSVLHFILLLIFSFLLFSLSYFKENRKILTLGTVLINVGNYGIPVILFAFGDSYIGILAVIIMVQNLFTFTLGPLILQRGKNSFRNYSKELIKIPSLYAIVIGFILKGLNVRLIPQIENPLIIIANGLISLALITLGIQLSRIKIQKNLPQISILSILRLCISPLLAFILVIIFGLSGILAAILIVAAGFPTAVNTYILSLEYENDYELASQLIFWTTLFSAVSVSILLLIT